MPSQKDIHAGQAVYTKNTLRLYDIVVLGLSNHLLWRCPTRLIRALYQRSWSQTHLDIGVGTGYFLDKVTPPVDAPAITLMDLNDETLQAASARIARYAPHVIKADCFQPIPTDQTYSSIGLNYLLHCISGNMKTKAVVFDHAKAALSEDGVLFGSTILQGDAPRSWAAQKLMDFYNSKGIFCNTDDHFHDLKDELEKRFTNVTLSRHGAVAIFEARNTG